MAGRPFGSLAALRRGGRRDPVSSRPYRPGDDLRAIDHRASARLSSARGRAELIVREHLAEEAPAVLIAVDDTPTMALHREGLPWLCKPAAVEAAVSVILASAARERCRAGRCALRPLEELVRRPAPKPGTFVFAVSDFLEPLPSDVLGEALDRRLDLVPVVVQDPTWERTFPEIAGVPLRVVDPSTGRPATVRLTRREVEERRAANQTRFAALLEGFAGLGLEPIVLDDAAPGEVFSRFLAWAEGRRRGLPWAA